MPAQELMKVEAKWQCLTVTVKLCAGPGGHLSHKLCHQSRHNAARWIDLLHTDTSDTCHVASILGVVNSASKPALHQNPHSPSQCYIVC